MSEWVYPFAESEVAAWKQQYGTDNIHLVMPDEGGHYVIRGLYRKEFMDLQNSKFRNEEDLEDKFVLQAMLHPALTEMALRESQAALANRLFEKLVEVSNVDAHKTKEVVELTEKNMLAEVKKDDLAAWKARHKGAKFYITEFEGKSFIYRGLRRNEYEKFRDAQREEGKNQIASENEIASLGVVFPMPKDFSPEGNTYLYGTISSLAVMIMKASGFGGNSTVTKL